MSLYGASMPPIRMSTLIAAMMAGAGPDSLSVHDHRRLHEVLVRLGQDFYYHDQLPPLEGIPDPEVGQRVPGVTRAVWDLSLAGALFLHEQGRVAEYHINPSEVKRIASLADDLPEEIQLQIQRRAADWSIAVSTDLKKSLQDA